MTIDRKEPQAAPKGRLLIEVFADEQWSIDPDTGRDVWTPAQPAIVPTGCPPTTIADLATIAGSKSTLAKACNVSERTIANWRSGDVAKVPFVAVVILARLANVELDDVAT